MKKSSRKAGSTGNQPLGRNHTLPLTRAEITSARTVLALTLIAVMYLATTPVHYPVVEDINDKVNHIAAFAVLALLADLSFPRHGFWLPKALLLLAYGLGIEVIQYFLPYRTFSLLDLLADAAGVTLLFFARPLTARLLLFRRR